MDEIENYFEETFPGKGVYARCVRSLQKFISVDPNSLLTKNHLKSFTIIKAETLRHLVLHRNVIHRFSRFRWNWNLIIIISANVQRVPCFLESLSVLTRFILFFFRYFWEFVMMITYGMAFIFLPYDVAFMCGNARRESYFLISVFSFIGKFL